MILVNKGIIEKLQLIIDFERFYLIHNGFFEI